MSLSKMDELMSKKYRLSVEDFGLVAGQTHEHWV